MEEHREAVTDPNMVEAGGSAQCSAEIPACHLKYKLKEYSWSSLARSPGGVTPSLSNKSLSPAG